MRPVIVLIQSVHVLCLVPAKCYNNNSSDIIYCILEAYQDCVFLFPDVSTGVDRMCTQVKSLSDIHSALANVTKWVELGQQLGVDEAIMAQIQESQSNDQLKTMSVLR